MCIYPYMYMYIYSKYKFKQKTQTKLSIFFIHETKIYILIIYCFIALLCCFHSKDINFWVYAECRYNRDVQLESFLSNILVLLPLLHNSHLLNLHLMPC
uniref:Transmembrane protein n=1 Tax=Medicago truncatula TaxID=3880 RepID=I3S281_MEDTR|nr:unknown [Medicago truncatula]